MDKKIGLFSLRALAKAVLPKVRRLLVDEPIGPPGRVDACRGRGPKPILGGEEAHI
jgi:hypothetical protein